MFQPFAVETRSGPHVSLQASTSQARRSWSLTARTSLKARVLRCRPWSASVETVGSHTRLVSGPTVVLDPSRPMSALSDPIGAALSGVALACLAVQYPEQLIGYAERLWAIPPGWYPVNRVLLARRSTSELLLDDEGNVIEAKGRWNRPPVRFELSRPHRSTGLGTVDLPERVRELLYSAAAHAWLGLTTRPGVGILPCCWKPAVGAVLPLAAAAHMAPSLPDEVCLTLDDNNGRRPDQKRGLMLRGLGTAVERSDTELVVSVEPTRVTYWDGFSTDTMPVT